MQGYVDAPEAKLYQLKFELAVSRRYHHARQKFFERIDRLSKLSSLVLALSAADMAFDFFEKLTGVPYLNLLIALLAALVMAFDMVVSAGKSAKQHHDLARQFIDIQISVEKLEGDVGKITGLNVARLIAEKLKIEKEEEPQLDVLTALCHNAEVRARGYSEKYQFDLCFGQRLLSNLVSVGKVKLPPAYQKSEDTVPPSPAGQLSAGEVPIGQGDGGKEKDS